MIKWLYVGVFMMGALGTGLAQETEAIKLPPPEMEGGKPLMQALKERHSTRSCRICIRRPKPPWKGRCRDISWFSVNWWGITARKSKRGALSQSD